MGRKFLKNKFEYNGNTLFEYLIIDDMYCDENTNTFTINYRFLCNYRTIERYSNNSHKTILEPINKLDHPALCLKDECFSCKITNDFLEKLDNFSDARVLFYKKEIVNKIISYEKYKNLKPSWYSLFKKPKLVCLDDFAKQNSKSNINEYLFVPIKEAMFVDLSNSSGCYIIKNTENNKCYVGQSTNLYKRIRTHFDIDTPKNPVFLEDYYSSSLKNKDNLFKITFIIEKDWDKLNELEKQLIERLNSSNPKFGYNTVEGGGSNIHSRRETIKETQFIKKLRNIKDNVLKLDYMDTTYKNLFEQVEKNHFEVTKDKERSNKMASELINNLKLRDENKRIELYNELLNIILTSDLLD